MAHHLLVAVVTVVMSHTQLRNASKPIMPQMPAPNNIISSTMNVHRVCSDESIETAIMTIGDATMKNEKWILRKI